jgi:hypothetical protein
MKGAVECIGTATARIERKAPGTLEMHYTERARFDPASCQENFRARQRLGKAGAYTLLVTLPEGSVVDADATNVDHFRTESTLRSIIALAVVASRAELRSIAKFYLRYFSQSFPARVFDDVEEARAWLNEVLANVDRQPK